MSEATLSRPVRTAKRRGFLTDVMVRLVKEKPMGMIGGVIVVALLLTGIFANFIAPYDPNVMIPGARLSAPSSSFLLGADNLGRDLLSRIIYGARISLIVGLVGAGLQVVIGFLIGGISGFYGGKLDLTIQRIVEVFMCFPPLILYPICPVLF